MLLTVANVEKEIEKNDYIREMTIFMEIYKNLILCQYQQMCMKEKKLN